VFQNWAKLDIDSAIQYANNLEEKYQHESAAQGILNAVDVNDVQRITELSKQLGLKINQNQYVSTALIENALQDPETAMQEALLMPRGYERESAMLGIIDTWATQNPEEAFAFTSEITDTILRQRLQESMFSRWAEIDPQTAYEMMLTLPNSVYQFGEPRS
jgi:hypothetical protein